MTKTTAKDDEDACYCIGGKRMKVGRGELKRSLGVGRERDPRHLRSYGLRPYLSG